MYVLQWARLWLDYQPDYQPIYWIDYRPYTGGLRVSNDGIAGHGLGMGPDLVPDLLPPHVPRLGFVWVLDLVQQLHRARGDHAPQVGQQARGEGRQGVEGKILGRRNTQGNPLMEPIREGNPLMGPIRDLPRELPIKGHSSGGQSMRTHS